MPNPFGWPDVIQAMNNNRYPGVKRGQGVNATQFTPENPFGSQGKLQSSYFRASPLNGNVSTEHILNALAKGATIDPASGVPMATNENHLPQGNAAYSSAVDKQLTEKEMKQALDMIAKQNRSMMEVIPGGLEPMLNTPSGGTGPKSLRTLE